MPTHYTVQFKNQPQGAKVLNVCANSEAEAIAQAGRDLGCIIDPTDPWDQSFSLEAILQTTVTPTDLFKWSDEMTPTELYNLLDNAGVNYEIVEIFEGARYLRIEVTENTPLDITTEGVTA